MCRGLMRKQGTGVWGLEMIGKAGNAEDRVTFYCKNPHVYTLEAFTSSAKTGWTCISKT